LSPLKPASSMPLGTWSRQVGAVRYKIDVKDNSLTAIVTISGEEKGKLISIDYILTADCYPTRNPGEIVGIISSFDISVDDESFDAIEGLKSLPDLQKEIGGKPMAFTFSVIEDVLVLGNVRLPFNKDESDEFVVAFRALGGRYKNVKSLAQFGNNPFARNEKSSRVELPLSRENKPQAESHPLLVRSCHWWDRGVRCGGIGWIGGRSKKQCAEIQSRNPGAR
jgi:hypothetical protein